MRWMGQGLFLAGLISVAWAAATPGRTEGADAAPQGVVPPTAPRPVAVDSAAPAKSHTTANIALPAKNVRTGQKLSYTLVSPPSHGTVSLAADRVENSSLPATVRYTSDRDYVGNDRFSWKVSNGVDDSNVATVTLTVAAAIPIPGMLMGFAAAGTSVDIPAAYSGGGGFTYTIQSGNPAHGTQVLNGDVFRYTPKPGYAGVDSFPWSFSYSKDAAAPTVSSPTGTCWIVVKPAGLTDWPQWRADEWRSGYTTMRLPAGLHLQWRRYLPTAPGAFEGAGSGLYPDIDFCRPVQLGQTIFVPVSARDCLLACDTDSGAVRWRFYASGAVRRPPVALDLAGGARVVIFGSDDGWVYALNAGDGTLRWKFRAAPNNRKAIGFGRLSSVWPVWASPVARDGRVYVAAGYVPSFGVYAYCLDAATGSVVWVNDGRISDMWNTSAFGPLALSGDGKQLYGSVEGAATPWVVDAASGEFLGHQRVGFGYPGGKHGIGYGLLSRKGTFGWYVDGMGGHNIPEPMAITVGEQTFSAASVAALGVTGTVASLLAGDSKLFVTTAEGRLYCFGGTSGKPVIHACPTNALPDVADGWTPAARAMLSRKDLKEGLALVLGIQSGRLVEELARQSSLMVVAVDTDHRMLQALRARMDAAGFPAARVATLEGDPMDFGFSPGQATLIASEGGGLANAGNLESMVERLYGYTRPFGGEIWIPSTEAQDAAIAGAVAASTKMPLSAVARQKAGGGPGGGFTQIRRTGLPDDTLRMKPPFGMVAFGTMGSLDRWLPIKPQGPGHVPRPPAYDGTPPGFPTASTLSTTNSIFTLLPNPLFSRLEKFPGMPRSGNDAACGGSSVPPNRYGDLGLSHGKLASFFDASAHYWGRLFLPELGGCPGRSYSRNGVVVVSANPVPGNACGCVAGMQFTQVALAPMEGEENAIAYQVARTGRPVDDLPIRRVGINFGAMGDFFAAGEGTLWTHHPHAGRTGRYSYNPGATPESMPLVPVSYQGRVVRDYHHSAQMDRTGPGSHGWVAASAVKGMSGLDIPLTRDLVALRTVGPVKVDGRLDDTCWDGMQKVAFTANPAGMDPNRTFGPPRADDECHVTIRYDDTNLYVAVGVRAAFAPRVRRFVTVTLNSREHAADDVVLTCEERTRKSTGIEEGDWAGASAVMDSRTFTCEMAVSWKALEAAGLWKDQLVMNANVCESPLAGRYVPLFLDGARGPGTVARPYTVRLFFAEMEGEAAGQRVFDVSLQGKPVLSRLDVVREAGGPKRELMKEIQNVMITDRLSIGFGARAGEPLLSGVELVGTYPVSGPGLNMQPTARIAASAESGPAPLEVTLSARKSQDPDGQIVDCVWETGDGRLARGSVLRHVFAEPGTYTVHLLVRDNRGGMAETNLSVKVETGVPAAFTCAIRATGGDYATLSKWELAMRDDLTAGSHALLFAVKNRGQYGPGDDGAGVTFSGGGKGLLKHINGEGVAFITDCSGNIQPGRVACASGHAFEVADSGHPVFMLVAECHNDWPGGLVDKLIAGPGWKTDANRCVVIRAAAGQGHKGRIKDRDGLPTGFMLKGDLDLAGLPYTRLDGVTVDPTGIVSMGEWGSVNRVRAGPVTLRGGGLMANSVGTTLAVSGSPSATNYHPSVYNINPREGPLPRGMAPPPSFGPGSHVGFHNCTGNTFDPANQPNVTFVNCLAAPGGKGFVRGYYADPSGAYHCVSTDGTATVWDSGDGSEGNRANQPVAWVLSNGGDRHLTATDTGARVRGTSGLGADADGAEWVGPGTDAGADAMNAGRRPRP